VFNLIYGQDKKDKTLADVRKEANGFTDNLIGESDICPTITSGGKFLCKQAPRWFNKSEYCSCGTYPLDYNFNGIEPKYLIGMSVPPVMIAQIARQIAIQWFRKQ
jgi:DNA (cytosine-5)-methyltransferase 1